MSFNDVFHVSLEQGRSCCYVLGILLRCWGSSNSAICLGQQVSPESSALNLCSFILVPTLLALGKGSGAQSSPEKEAGLWGAGLQLFRAITSCPSFISNVARVSPFEKRNQRQVRQGTEGAEVKADLEGQEAKQTCKFGVRGGSVDFRTLKVVFSFWSFLCSHIVCFPVMF